MEENVESLFYDVLYLHIKYVCKLCIAIEMIEMFSFAKVNNQLNTPGTAGGRDRTLAVKKIKITLKKYIF